jgi:hypothetical protein
MCDPGCNLGRAVNGEVGDSGAVVDIEGIKTPPWVPGNTSGGKESECFGKRKGRAVGSGGGVDAASVGEPLDAV